MAYIYKIINDINDKVYVGKTEFSIEKRFREHCQDAFRSRTECRPLYNAMQKYGTEHFHIELIEETDNPNEREIFWVEQLHTYEDGYNATKGGDGKRRLDYDYIISIYNQTNNTVTTAKICNCGVDSVRDILKNNGVNILGHEEVIKNTYSKQVAQIDKATGEVIAIYPSITEAGVAVGDPKGANISRVCNGKRKTCKGFVWVFVDY